MSNSARADALMVNDSGVLVSSNEVSSGRFLSSFLASLVR
jgi:hypothetical protein